jgi:uncharacterized membrane protein
MDEFTKFAKQTKLWRLIIILVITLIIAYCVFTPLIETIQRTYEPQLGINQLKTETGSTEYVLISILLSGWIGNTLNTIVVLICAISLLSFGIRVYKYKFPNKE